MKWIEAKFSIALMVAIATATATVLLTQVGKASASELQCSETDSGFRISLEEDGGSTSLLTVSDASSVSQSCGGVASRLEAAINAPSLAQLMLVADNDREICIVRSIFEGCSNSNRLLDIPRGMDGDEFLNSILDIGLNGFFAGNALQQSTRPYYVKLGQGLTELLGR